MRDNTSEMQLWHTSSMQRVHAVTLCGYTLHVTCATQHARAPFNGQHTSCKRQHATDNRQHATDNRQHATCNMQHARATFNGQHTLRHARDNVQLARHTPCNRHHEIGTRCDTQHATCLLENGRVTLALAVDSALQCTDARVNNRVHESREPCRSYSHGTLKRVCRTYRMTQGLRFRTALTLPTDRSSAELRAGFKFRTRS
jgi:hypothetical protein